MSARRAVRIAAEGLGLVAGDTRILRDVRFALDARRVAVIGANGSGKTSFARLVTGLVRPTEGTVEVDGVAVGAAGPRHAERELRRSTGFLFSNPDVQIVMPTVAEDIAFTLSGRGVPRAEIPQRVDRMLDRLGLGDLRDASAHSLSGGQKQLLAVAAVLVAEPRLVVADEPTAYLDGANARRIAGLLLHEMQPSLLLVTHDLGLAARCDAALRFSGGRLAGVGDPADEIAAYERELDLAAP